MERSSKVPVVLRDEYTMYLELFDNLLWFHTDVHKWTVEVKKRFESDLECLQGLVGLALVAMIPDVDKRLGKFARSIGFREKGQVMLLDGSQAFVYVLVRKGE